jgi:hypothetical protein
MGTSPKKNQRVEKDAIRFEVKVMIKFVFEFEFFSIDHKQYKLFCVNFL